MSKLTFSLIYLLFFLLTTLMFSDPITSYFSQDDFFHLRQVMDKQISDIPSLFSPYNDLGYAFYRPISREIYYFIMFNLFNLNPLPYHLVNFFLIFINSYLLFKFVMVFDNHKKNMEIGAYIASFLYLVNSVHSIELYYLASVQTLFATTFILLGLVNFLKNKLFSVIFFILAICSHEFAVVFIPLLLLIEFLTYKNISLFILKRIFFNLLPFLIILLLRSVVFFIQSGLPQQDVYRAIFSLKSIFNTLGWYILWSFSVPEILVDFVGPKFALNQNFIKWYKDYTFLNLPLLLFIIVSLFIFAIRSRNLLMDRKFLFYPLSFIVSIGPSLFFPHHKFVYYLSLPLVWFSITIGQILGYSWFGTKFSRPIIILVIISFIILSYQTTQLNKITHWSAKRASAAKVFLDNIKKNNPNPKKESIFYIKDDPNYPFISSEWGSSSKQAFYILSGSDALQLLYNDSSIKAYYQSVGDLPSDLKNKEIISITAEFPY